MNHFILIAMIFSATIVHASGNENPDLTSVITTIVNCLLTVVVYFSNLKKGNKE